MSPINGTPCARSSVLSPSLIFVRLRFAELFARHFTVKDERNVGTQLQPWVPRRYEHWFLEFRGVERLSTRIEDGLYKSYST